MCLAIPGKILEIDESQGLPMGKVDFSGAEQLVCLAQVDGADVGKYVLVHAGFAISVLDEEEALSSLELWSDMIEKAKNNDDYNLKWENA